MDERTVGQLNIPLFAPYRHSAAPGFCLEGDLWGLEQLLGFEADTLAGKGFAELIATESRDQMIAKMTVVLEKGNVELFVPLRGQDGSVRWFLNRGRTVAAEDGSVFVEGVLVEADDTYRRLAAEREVMEQYRDQLSRTENMVSSLQIRAEQDSLTGLLNAGTTRALTEKYLKTRENPCALIIIDVDNFKRVNDSYGHLAGDEAMTGASAALKKLFRANDIVGRIGGDEFLVLMKDVAQQEIVELRCAQIVRGFRGIMCDYFPKDTVSCSVGAVFATALGKNYDELFCCADKAMYRSKTAGGNRYSIEVL